MKITKQQVQDVVKGFGLNGATSEEVGKKLGVTANTALYRLNQLMGDKIIRRVRAGTSVIYKLNSAPPVTKDPIPLKNTVPLKEAKDAISECTPPNTRPGKITWVPDPTPAPMVSIEGLLDDMVNTLADAVMARIKHQVKTRMRETLTEVTADIEKYHAPAEKIKLRKIFVGGAIPKQVSVLRREFAGVCELVFANSDENCGTWQSRARDAYVSILWTNFVSHKHGEYLTSIGIKPVLHTGGIATLKDKIMEMCI